MSTKVIMISKIVKEICQVQKKKYVDHIFFLFYRLLNLFQSSYLRENSFSFFIWVVDYNIVWIVYWLSLEAYLSYFGRDYALCHSDFHLEFLYL